MLYFHNDNFIESGGGMECIIRDDAYKSSDTRQTARRVKNPPNKLAVTALHNFQKFRIPTAFGGKTKKCSGCSPNSLFLSSFRQKCSTAKNKKKVKKIKSKEQKGNSLKSKSPGTTKTCAEVPVNRSVVVTIRAPAIVTTVVPRAAAQNR